MNILKRSLAVLMAVIMIMSYAPLISDSIIPTAQAWGDEKTKGIYTYFIEDEYCWITEIDESVSGDLVIPEKIDGYEVQLEEYAVYGLDKITSITLPKSVTAAYHLSTCDNLEKIIVDKESEHLTVSKKILMSKDKCVVYGAVPKGLKSVVIPSSVDSIANGAFSDCKELESVTINDAMWSIGSGAFYGCENIKKVYIKDLKSWCNTDISYDSNPLQYGADLYLNGEKVTKLKIPSTVSNIGEYTFEGCSSIVSVTIPDSVSMISEYAFRNCKNLESVTFGKNLQLVENDAFYGCSKIKTVKAKSLESWCRIDFYSNSNPLQNGADFYVDGKKITEITIPKDITELKSYVFAGANFTNATIPSSVKTIGEGVFNNCKKLKKVTVADGVKTTLPGNIFAGCDALETVKIGSGITQISRSDFEGCTNLKSISVSSKNKNYTTVDGVLFTKDKKTLVLYPATASKTSYSIPKGVKIIGESSFANAKNLQSVKIPSGVTEIGGSAFSGARKLKSVNIPKTVKVIQYSAFASTAISKITIPESVTAIENSLFRECENLETVKLGKNVATIDTTAFNGCSALKTLDIPEKAELLEDFHGVGDRGFIGMNSLESITVHKKNKNLSSVDGVLYNKDKTIIIKYPSAKEDVSLKLPSTVESIYPRAFVDCDNLEKIELNKGLKSITYTSFIDCDNIKTIDMPNTVTYVAYNSFVSCSGLETVKIGSGLESGFAMFSNCDNLKKIEVNSKNKNFTSKDGVLYDKKLTQVVSYPNNNPMETYKLPDTVEYVGGDLGVNLKSISVSSKNKSFASEKGVLYDKDKNRMICYPAGKTDKSFTVPANVESVSVMNNKYLQNIYVSKKNQVYSSIDGILYSKDGTVLIQVPAGKKLTSFTVPKNVIGIYSDAFSGCTEIKKFAVASGNKNFYVKDGILFEVTDYSYEFLIKYPAAKSGKTYNAGNNVNFDHLAFDDVKYLKKVYTNSDAYHRNDISTLSNGVKIYYKHPSHITDEKTTQATLTKNGSVKEVCTICDEAVKTVSTIYYPKTIKLAKTSYTYTGKAITPSVTVKDSKGNTLKKDKDYTVKYSSGRKNPGKYSVTVTFKGKYSGTKKLYFTIKPAKATLNKVTAGSKSAVLAWKTVKGVSGYQVQYSTSSKFKSAKTVTVKKESSTKTTIKKLTKNKKYYFKVRAYKTIDGKKVFGAWSSVKNVKVK